MTHPEELRTLLDTLLAARHTAFALRQHAVSFHALSAAGHAAEVLEDLDALEEIGRLAHEELAWIDANDPGHRHSSASAALRHHQSIFAQLALTAAGMRQRILSDRRLQELHSGQ